MGYPRRGSLATLAAGINGDTRESDLILFESHERFNGRHGRHATGTAAAAPPKNRGDASQRQVSASSQLHRVILPRVIQIVAMRSRVAIACSTAVKAKELVLAAIKLVCCTVAQILQRLAYTTYHITTVPPPTHIPLAKWSSELWKPNKNSRCP